MVYFNAKKLLASATPDAPSSQKRLSELLDKSGTSARRLRYIRLAGSNGKTVLAEMLMAVLKNAGYKVGCLRMPMREEPRENICVDSTPLTMDEFSEHTGAIKSILPSLSFAPSTSELLLCVALLAFEKAGCNLCIIESDHFGDDPSHFLPPPFSAVICGTIPNDDTEQISRIRSYICKGITEIVSAPQNSEAYRIISNTCYSVNCRLTLPSKTALTIDKVSIGGTEFTYEKNRYSLGLCGRFQVSNAVLLLETVKMLTRKGYKLDSDAVSKALAKLRIPAKFETVSISPLIILDSTHTPVAIETVCDSLADFKHMTGTKVRLCLPDGEIIGQYIKALNDRGYTVDEIFTEGSGEAVPSITYCKNKKELAKKILSGLDRRSVLLVSGEHSFVMPLRHNMLEILNF